MKSIANKGMFMEFYVIVHIAIGFLAGSGAVLISDWNKANFDQQMDMPYWVVNGLGYKIGLLCLGSAFLALITSLVNFGLYYALLTLGEMLVGVFITRLVPIKARYIALILSPLILLYLLGALWGFWFIG